VPPWTHLTSEAGTRKQTPLLQRAAWTLEELRPLVSSLATLPLMRESSAAALETVARNAVLHEYPPEHKVLQEGDPAFWCFYLLSGSVSLHSKVRARWVMLRARWVTLRARWVTLRARWETLRARTIRRERFEGPGL
jgi:hypothetical protein